MNRPENAKFPDFRKRGSDLFRIAKVNRFTFAQLSFVAAPSTAPTLKSEKRLQQLANAAGGRSPKSA